MKSVFLMSFAISISSNIKKIISKTNLYLIALNLMICCNLNAQISFNGGELKLKITENGFIQGIINAGNQKNYIATDTVAPLLTLVGNKNTRYLPSSALYNKTQKKITLVYKEVNANIDIKVYEKSTHIVLEIIRAIPADKIETVIWGPYPTTINKIVGEVIGVVRDETVAVGLQVLNIKTLGGDYPNNEGSTWKRGIAAVSKQWGSLIQAYCINRDKQRNVDAWGGIYKNMPVAALKGESVVGSKIALFTCEEVKTLDRLEQIELAEGLPHPTIKGVWFKKSPLFGKSYLISSFNEENVDEMITYTKRAGLISLYHEGPFQSWGHFILNPKHFPNGKEGLKNCVDKAHAAGLMMGVHTLTNFMNTNDSYVTPVPDDRLAITGASVLVNDIDTIQKEVEVASPEYFNTTEGNHLHAVKIGKEIIRYKKVTETLPYILLDCQRGAFGTIAASHKKGEAASKLFDHSYKVFFPNIEMQREVAKNIAALMNETGVDHLDFDGHEGGLASGEGDYGAELFSKDVYDNVKHDFINGTSRSSTFYWHIGSYYNWGEPWYGGFKESMQQYRIDNQGLFDRNYMPHMLGWYLLTEKTTIPEMEWMLARAAGYNAGFAMVANHKSLKNNPITGDLLDAIREWEMARNGHAFTSEQNERLKDPKIEFHLEKISDGKWELLEYGTSPTLIREKFIRQPGEPTYTTWSYKQEWKEQPVQFRLHAKGKEGGVSEIKMHIDNYAEIVLPIVLKAGESILCDGSNIIKIYNSAGRIINNYKLKEQLPLMEKGDHIIIADCTFDGEEAPILELQFKGVIKKELCFIQK